MKNATPNRNGINRSECRLKQHCRSDVWCVNEVKTYQRYSLVIIGDKAKHFKVKPC